MPCSLRHVLFRSKAFAKPCLLFSSVNTNHATGKFSRRQTNDIFFFFFLEDTICKFIQIVSLHRVTYTIAKKNKRTISRCRLLKFYPACKILKELKNLTWMLKATRSIAVLVSASLNKLPRTASTINLKNI